MSTKTSYFTIIAIIIAITKLTQSKSYYKPDFGLKHNHKNSLKKLLQWRSRSVDSLPNSQMPVIYGFRAESAKHPIVTDENGLTVIPDKALITLRLFGNHLSAHTGANGHWKLLVGFTWKEGTAGDRCDPDKQFTAHKVINDNVALVKIMLSETIRDDPYYVCYGVDTTGTAPPTDAVDDFSAGNKGLSLWSGLGTGFQYISSDEALKLRVIGRQLAVGYRSRDADRDANVKMKMTRIMEEVNKIHRLTDEMQDWGV